MAAPQAPVPPSGAQHEIRHGDQHAVVVEVGGGLRSYTVAGVDRLDGYTAEEPCSGGRGQPLMPWPNRLRDGRYEFDGSKCQLPITEVGAGNAIHGLTRWANWTCAERGPGQLAMEHVLYPQPGWPGTLALRIEYELGNDGLAVTITAANAGAQDCPFGAGFHPYLTLGTATIDSLIVQAPGTTYLEADERGIPVSVHPVDDAGPLDFRSPRELGDAVLDHCFTDLERDEDGLARVRLDTAGGGPQASLWVDASFDYLMLFTGDTLAPDARRRGLAIEPMTCPANALQSGEGLVRLAPGASFSGRWGISQSG